MEETRSPCEQQQQQQQLQLQRQQQRERVRESERGVSFFLKREGVIFKLQMFRGSEISPIGTMKLPILAVLIPSLQT